jgi:hypothetical protein
VALAGISGDQGWGLVGGGTEVPPLLSHGEALRSAGVPVLYVRAPLGHGQQTDSVQDRAVTVPAGRDRLRVALHAGGRDMVLGGRRLAAVGAGRQVLPLEVVERGHWRLYFGVCLPERIRSAEGGVRLKVTHAGTG